MQGAGLEVWTARPDALGAEGCAALARLLDAHERERAARLNFEEDHRAFVIAHAMRRMALGLALATDPADLRFAAGAHGQPVLLHAGATPAFSLTRSRDLVAFALSVHGPVGIDVEPVRDGVDAQLLAPYMDVPGVLASDEDFYVHWTALEAFWKAQGLGLSASHPRIALRENDAGALDVVFARGGVDAGLVVMRLPSAPSHVLSLACASVQPVRMVALEQLAGAPATGPNEAPFACRRGNCPDAVAPNIFSS